MRIRLIHRPPADGAFRSSCSHLCGLGAEVQFSSRRGNDEIMPSDGPSTGPDSWNQIACKLCLSDSAFEGCSRHLRSCRRIRWLSCGLRRSAFDRWLRCRRRRRISCWSRSCCCCCVDSFRIVDVREVAPSSAKSASSSRRSASVIHWHTSPSIS